VKNPKNGLKKALSCLAVTPIPKNKNGVNNRNNGSQEFKKNGNWKVIKRLTPNWKLVNSLKSWSKPV